MLISYNLKNPVKKDKLKVELFVVKFTFKPNFVKKISWKVSAHENVKT